MELKDQEKQIIKDFIQALGELWQLEPYQVVRKIGRCLNMHDSIVIIKMLYEIIRESE